MSQALEGICARRVSSLLQLTFRAASLSYCLPIASPAGEGGGGVGERGVQN